MLAVTELNAGYDSMQVLWSVNLQVAESSITSLLGANGVGKSTLLHSVMGMTKIYGGRITFDADDVTRLPAHRKVDLGLTMTPEGKHLFGDMTVEENLAMGAYPRHARAKAAHGRAEVFDLFPRLAERKNQKAGSLSGGEQQMLAIARALMTAPRLLMLDEPSQGLAPKLVGEMFQTIARLRDAAGLTILIVDQNATAALQIADYAYVMDEGAIGISGPAEEIARRDDIRRAYLGV